MSQGKGLFARCWCQLNDEMSEKLCILSQFHISLLLIAFGRMIRKITLYPRFLFHTPHLFLLACHCGRLFIWMHNLSFLFTVIVRPAGCCSFATRNIADDAARDAARFELCSAPAMSKRIRLAPELAGLLRVCHYALPPTGCGCCPGACL